CAREDYGNYEGSEFFEVW
nr:immunoglobulin heavy chain junction region [Macaca mulatta]MOX62118.1 immunoglobulin heavy chain junction region [Macaca mulatta]